MKRNSCLMHNNVEMINMIKYHEIHIIHTIFIFYEKFLQIVKRNFEIEFKYLILIANATSFLLAYEKEKKNWKRDEISRVVLMEISTNFECIAVKFQTQTYQRNSLQFYDMQFSFFSHLRKSYLKWCSWSWVHKSGEEVYSKQIKTK